MATATATTTLTSIKKKMNELADEMAKHGGGYMRDGWYHELSTIACDAGNLYDCDDDNYSTGVRMHDGLFTIWQSSRMANRDVIILSLRLLADTIKD